MLEIVAFTTGLVLGMILVYVSVLEWRKDLMNKANQILEDARAATAERDQHIRQHMDDLHDENMALNLEKDKKQIKLDKLHEEVHALHAMLKWLAQYCNELKPRGTLHDPFNKMWQEAQQTRRNNNAIQ